MHPVPVGEVVEHRLTNRPNRQHPLTQLDESPARGSDPIDHIEPRLHLTQCLHQAAPGGVDVPQGDIAPRDVQT